MKYVSSTEDVELRSSQNKFEGIIKVAEDDTVMKLTQLPRNFYLISPNF